MTSGGGSDRDASIASQSPTPSVVPLPASGDDPAQTRERRSRHVDGEGVQIDPVEPREHIARIETRIDQHLASGDEEGAAAHGRVEDRRRDIVGGLEREPDDLPGKRQWRVEGAARPPART